MNLKFLSIEDIPKIKILWKENRENLGIPFNKTLEELIEKESFLGLFDNNNLIGMCDYRIMKRNPSIRIVKLCVQKEYRNNGYATMMIKKIIELLDNVDLPIYIECKDGAENNSFYDKIAYFERIEDRKTMKVRFYKLNREEWR